MSPAPIGENYLSDLLPELLAEFERHGQRAKYFDDVALWAKNMLGIDLWYKQVEIADDIALGKKKSVAVRAGHGVGKSFLAGILASWWIDTRPIQYVFVASTAPSADQVGAILWREIRNNWMVSHHRYKEFRRLTERGQDTGNLPDHALPGRITQDNKWKDDLGNLIGQGRKPPDNKEDSFQGIHAEYVLAIGDEACGLRENMIDDLSNITSNEKSRRLLIGNPTNPRSRFGDIFSDKLNDDGQKISAAWSLHHISVLDSPNFHGRRPEDMDPENPYESCECHPDVDKGLGMDEHALASLTDQGYVDEKRMEYGDSSARFKARVLGQFAFDAGNNLFSEYLMGKARDAVCYIDYSDEATTVVLGIDVARSETGDWTYVYSYTSGTMYVLDDETGEKTKVGDAPGGKLRFVAKYRGVPLTDIYDEEDKLVRGQATLFHQHALELGASEIRIDSGGLGVGAIDGLKFLNRGQYKIAEMQSGGPTPDGRSWNRNRDYQFDQMSKRFKAGLVDVDPQDFILITQLEDITYNFIDPHGAMQIESKDSMKKRGVKSPDAADAAWYACADLTHLQGPQDGDVIVKSAADVIREAMLSGFRDAYSY